VKLGDGDLFSSPESTFMGGDALCPHEHQREAPSFKENAETKGGSPFGTNVTVPQPTDNLLQVFQFNCEQQLVQIESAEL
jgi:hypothetical protein